MKLLKIAKLNTLFRLLGEDSKVLATIVERIDSYYFEDLIRKKSGELRVLHKPRYKLKRIQSKIKKLLSMVELPECVHGWVKGKSIKSALEQHLGMKYLYCFDIRSYFDSINNGHVLYLFSKKLNCSPEVASLFTKLSTYRFCLPQGSPCSPVIANLILFDFDTSLAGYAKRQGIEYSRLGDDIILSSNRKILRLEETVVNGLKRIGLKLNIEKSKTGVPIKSGVKVLGVVVGSGISVSKKYRREVMAILYNAKSTGLDAQNLDGRFDMRGYLLGRINFIGIFSSVLAENLKKELEKLKD